MEFLWQEGRAGSHWGGRAVHTQGLHPPPRQTLPGPEVLPQQTGTQNNRDLRVVAAGILPQSIDFLLRGLLSPRTDQELIQLPTRASPSQPKLDFNLTLISALFCASFPVLWFSFPGKCHSKLKSDAPAAFWYPWLLRSRVRSVSKGPEHSQCSA